MSASTEASEPYLLIKAAALIQISGSSIRRMICRPPGEIVKAICLYLRVFIREATAAAVERRREFGHLGEVGF
jgi:hypothetical protein